MYLKTTMMALAMALGSTMVARADAPAKDTQLAVGGRVEVRGSKVSIAGKPAVIAAEVKKGNETLQLRDAQGLPLWRGWR